MKDLQEATEQICKLKGEAMGMQCVINAILRALPPREFEAVMLEYEQEIEVARVVLLNHASIGDAVIHGLDTYAQQVSAMTRQRGMPYGDPS